MPESLVPVSRFHGSRLASAPSPSPFQKGQNGSSDSSKPLKVARSSSSATIGAAIVAAEDSLENDVCILAQGNIFCCYFIFS